MDKYVIQNTTVFAGPKISDKGDADECMNLAINIELVMRKITALNLCCEYGILFRRQIADTIFKKLENEVCYLEPTECQLTIFGKTHIMPRSQVGYGDDGVAYSFSGTTLKAKPWIPIVKQLRDAVRDVTKCNYNFVLINRYKDGNDHISEHQDNEEGLVIDAPIASLSFGQHRDFVLRHRDARGKNGAEIEPVKITLEHGSLLVMRYPTNVYWFHSIPVRKKIVHPRVNLTFRLIKK